MRTTFSIKDIAVQVGYTSSGRLAQHFKRGHETTPHAYAGPSRARAVVSYVRHTFSNRQFLFSLLLRCVFLQPNELVRDALNISACKTLMFSGMTFKRHDLRVHNRKYCCVRRRPVLVTLTME
jgi:hypothetical protein